MIDAVQTATVPPRHALAPWRRASELMPSWLWGIASVRTAIAGMFGGVAMGAFEMMVTLSIAPGLLKPLELIGASHPIAIAHPALVGAAMHVVTAAFWGTKLGGLVSAAPRRLFTIPRAVVVGLAWGAGVWVVMGKIIAPLLNPMIINAPEPQFLMGHIVYGVVTATSLAAMTRRRPTATASVGESAA